MKYTLYLPVIIIYCLLSKSLHAQFYNAFNSSYFFENETSAIELGNDLVFGYTVTSSFPAYHKNILLVKTNRAGNILWSKRFDAGTGISIKLYEMIRTAGNEILVAGETGTDNSGNHSGLLLKINAAGILDWAKKFTTDDPYSSRGLVQLQDSSFVLSFETTQHYPGLIQVNSSGNILAAVQFSNRQFQQVQSVTARQNTATVVIGNTTVANINFTTQSVTGQKQYNTSNQFTALIQARCKNGDNIYLAGRTYGGLLSGTSRIFRSTAGGNLLWAKNIKITQDPDGSVFSIFDIVSQVYIHEAGNGDIVAMVASESTDNVVLVFNANGQYLSHRYLSNPYNFIAEAANGSYLQVSASFTNGTRPMIFSNRFPANHSTCDSSLFVAITNGTDSAAVPDNLLVKKAVVTASDIPVSSINVTIQPYMYCNILSSKSTREISSESVVSIVPNPASDKLIVKTKQDLPFLVYSAMGSVQIRSVTNHTTLISSLLPGVYKVVIHTKEGIITKTFIKD